MTAAAGDRREHQRRERDGEQLLHLGENVRLHGWGGAVQEALQVGLRHPLLRPLPAHGPPPCPRLSSPLHTALLPLSSRRTKSPGQTKKSPQETEPTGGIQPNPPPLCTSAVCTCSARTEVVRGGEIEARTPEEEDGTFYLDCGLPRKGSAGGGRRAAAEHGTGLLA